jgi:hypothetical protein
MYDYKTGHDRFTLHALIVHLNTILLTLYNPGQESVYEMEARGKVNRGETSMEWKAELPSQPVWVF